MNRGTRLTTTFAIVLMTACSCEARRAFAQDAEQSAYPQDTPEAAFKSFTVAMMAADEQALKKLALPADDFDRLISKNHPSPEQVEQIRKSIISKMKLTQLKAGEEFKLPNGKVLKIGAHQDTHDRVVLLPVGAPVPTEIHRVKSVWRVDARPIIAARKAAEEARKRAEKSKTKPQAKED